MAWPRYQGPWPSILCICLGHSNQDRYVCIVLAASLSSSAIVCRSDSPLPYSKYSAAPCPAASALQHLALQQVLCSTLHSVAPQVEMRGALQLSELLGRNVKQIFMIFDIFVGQLFFSTNTHDGINMIPLLHIEAALPTAHRSHSHPRT